MLMKLHKIVGEITSEDARNRIANNTLETHVKVVYINVNNITSIQIENHYIEVTHGDDMEENCVFIYTSDRSNHVVAESLEEVLSLYNQAVNRQPINVRRAV